MLRIRELIGDHTFMFYKLRFAKIVNIIFKFIKYLDQIILRTNPGMLYVSAVSFSLNPSVSRKTFKIQ